VESVFDEQIISEHLQGSNIHTVRVYVYLISELLEFPRPLNYINDSSYFLNR